FRGGWTLEAAADVATATLPALAALVDKSLVRLVRAGARATALPRATADSRFTLLEPIREYALEQLALRGETEALQRSHARYYVALAEAAAAQWDSPTAETMSNSSTVNTTISERRCAGCVMAVTIRLGFGLLGRCEQAISLLEDAVTQHRARGDRGSLSAGGLGLALYGLGLLLREQGEFTRAATLFEECVELHRALGDREGIAQAQLALGDIA